MLRLSPAMLRGTIGYSSIGSAIFPWNGLPLLRISERSPSIAIAEEREAAINEKRELDGLLRSSVTQGTILAVAISRRADSDG